MENVVPSEAPKTRGQKISAALTGKKWSPERRETFRATIRAGRKLREEHLLTCKLEDHSKCENAGFRIGRPVKSEVSQ